MKVLSAWVSITQNHCHKALKSSNNCHRFSLKCLSSTYHHLTPIPRITFPIIKTRKFSWNPSEIFKSPKNCKWVRHRRKRHLNIITVDLQPSINSWLPCRLHRRRFFSLSFFATHIGSKYWAPNSISFTHKHFKKGWRCDHLIRLDGWLQCIHRENCLADWHRHCCEWFKNAFYWFWQDFDDDGSQNIYQLEIVMQTVA